jgi:predicted HD superfamily hydrolase involved in NAD metabolism
MDVAPTALDGLRERVRRLLTPHRFAHTLGVEACVKRLGERFGLSNIGELRAAALLHDITKEYSDKEHIALLDGAGITPDAETRRMTALLHSMTAPLVIRRDFHEFATDALLSAVACHTTGKVGMSLFDKILFIADYIEDGRTYASCVAVRDRLWQALGDEAVPPESALDEAVLASLDHTVCSLVSRGSLVSVDTVLARNALIGENSHR